MNFRWLCFTLLCALSVIAGKEIQKYSNTTRDKDTGAEIFSPERENVDYCKIQNLECPYANRTAHRMFMGFNANHQVNTTYKHTCCPYNVSNTYGYNASDEKFRRAILNWHNEKRNSYASGKHQGEGWPPASNMLALGYDLQLEHTAFCSVRWVSFLFCKDTSDSKGVDFIRAINVNDEEIPDVYYIDVMESRFKNITDMSVENASRIVNNYTGPEYDDPTVYTHDFSIILWWSARYIGCVRSHLKQKNASHSAGAYRILCHYAGMYSTKGNSMTPMHRFGKKMWSTGTPCSECPDDMKCNNEEGGKWDSLCGPGFDRNYAAPVTTTTTSTVATSTTTPAPKSSTTTKSIPASTTPASSVTTPATNPAPRSSTTAKFIPTSTTLASPVTTPDTTPAPDSSTMPAPTPAIPMATPATSTTTSAPNVPTNALITTERTTAVSTIPNFRLRKSRRPKKKKRPMVTLGDDEFTKTSTTECVFEYVESAPLRSSSALILLMSGFFLLGIFY